MTGNPSPTSDLGDNVYPDVALMVTLLNDVERAVTDEEKAAAELALNVEITLQMAGMRERSRARALAMARRSVLNGEG